RMMPGGLRQMADGIRDHQRGAPVSGLVLADNVAVLQRPARQVALEAFRYLAVGVGAILGHGHAFRVPGILDGSHDRKNPFTAKQLRGFSKSPFRATWRPMIDRRFSIAPMMEWTDRHCRFFHRLLTRRALLYTEMITTMAVLRGDRTRLLAF